MVDFFLENGKINVALTKDNDAVTGTPNNDAYQEIREFAGICCNKASFSSLHGKKQSRR